MANVLTGKPLSEEFYKLEATRRLLPVFASRNEISKMVLENQVTVIVGETGSGKTTQIPQFLLQDLKAFDKKRIAVTQPRRIAATSVAARVAQELDVTLGEHVGYSVRFDQLFSESTKIKYLTDGMLLREAITDHLLTEYSVIIVDEAHERTLPSDILLGLLKKLCIQRPLSSENPLRIVVMSATLDADTFSKYYSGAPTLLVPGRTFPVDIIYQKQTVEDYVEGTVDCVLKILKNESEGDILVFLTGQDEIDDVCSTLKQKTNELSRDPNSKVGEMIILPLYSSLPPQQQSKVFKPAPKSENDKINRKIIVSTNIAETSLTIDGVVYVVDCGLSKQNVYEPRLNVSSLLPAPISKASAQQRAGRAGRTRPGKCFRLYTLDYFNNEMQQHSHPSIITSNIANVVLLLKRIGIDDLVKFDFINAPAPETMMRALELLFHLKAIGQDLQLTEKGMLMSEFPLDPPLSAAIISSLQAVAQGSRIVNFADQQALVNSMLSIVSMLSVAPCWVRPPYKEQHADKAHSNFHHKYGDHLTLNNVFNEYINQIKVIGISAEESISLDEIEEPKTLVKPKKALIDRWCFDNYVNSRSLFSAASVRKQLAGILLGCAASLKVQNNLIIKDYEKSMEIIAVPSDFVSREIIKSLVSSFFLNVAFQTGKGMIYQTVVDSHQVALHPSCCLLKKTNASTNRKWILYHERLISTKHYVRTVTAIPDQNIFFNYAPKEWYKSFNLK